jgi:hypothetical protein
MNNLPDKEKTFTVQRNICIVNRSALASSVNLCTAPISKFTPHIQFKAGAVHSGRGLCQSRRISPRSLCEIRRCFSKDFHVQSGAGQFLAKSAVLRFQVRWRPACLPAWRRLYRFLARKLDGYAGTSCLMSQSECPAAGPPRDRQRSRAVERLPA